MIELYGWVKWMHIVSATLLLGTGIGTAFQLWAAHRRRKSAALAAVARNTVWADWLFTAPTAVAQPVTGLALVHITGVDAGASWLVASWALYAVAMACWVRVAQLQYRVARLAEHAHGSSTTLPEAGERAMREWFRLGWPALAALLATLALMVMKPTLW